MSKIGIKQTVEEAAHFFAESRSSGSAFPAYYHGFIAGAEWQAKQSPWIRVKDRLPEKGEYDWVLVLLRDKRDGFIGIPEIGELREDGFWHTKMSDTFNTPSFRRTYNTTDVLGEFLNQEVIAWMPIPSFNEIIESNKDVLRRMKENGD